MRTTVRIDDELLKRAKKRAADEGRTLTSLLEEGLAVILAQPKGGARERAPLPTSGAAGGDIPGIDLNRFCDLEEVINKP